MTQSSIGAIVQARMSASRLPGKVLHPIAGKPMLLYLLERLQRCDALDAIVVATSTQDSEGTCDANTVRLDQIRCWWKRGERELKYTQDVGTFKRRRAIDHRIMLLHDLCMEAHGWQRPDWREPW